MLPPTQPAEPDIPVLPRFSTVSEERVVERAARAAEDLGDLRGARRLVSLLPSGEDRARWLASLDSGLSLSEDDAVGWSAWVLGSAWRAAAASPPADLLLGVAEQALRAGGLVAAERTGRVLAAALRDPLVVDAALFDLGLLEAYRREHLGPVLTARAVLLGDWADRAVSVVEVIDAAGPVAAPPPDGQILVRDLGNGRETLVQLDRPFRGGELLYGRLLPVPGPEGSWHARFALAPIPLDRLAARRVLRAIARSAPIEERLRAVVAFRRRAGKPAARQAA